MNALSNTFRVMYLKCNYAIVVLDRLGCFMGRYRFNLGDIAYILENNTATAVKIQKKTADGYLVKCHGTNEVAVHASRLYISKEQALNHYLNK